MERVIQQGNSAGNVMLEETGPNTAGDFLDAPTHTPPQSKSPSPFSLKMVWVEEEG